MNETLISELNDKKELEKTMNMKENEIENLQKAVNDLQRNQKQEMRQKHDYI